VILAGSGGGAARKRFGMGHLQVRQEMTMKTAAQRSRTYVLTLVCLILWSCTHAPGMNAGRKEDMSTYKKDVTLWYEAFSKKDPTILDRILSENWVDIPAPPNISPDQRV
jgi:hypothetical protein